MPFQPHALGGSNAQFGTPGGAASTQYAGTGIPPTVNIPFTLFQYFGQPVAGVPTPVSGTTQAGSVIAKYFNATLDDSAEAFSAGCFMVDPAPSIAYTQTKPVVGLEGDGGLRNDVICTSKVIGVVGGVSFGDTSQGTDAMAFYANAGTVAAGSTLTNYYGYFAELPSGTAPTNQWSFYGRGDVQAEGRLFVNAAGAQAANLAQAAIFGPNVSGGATERPALLVQQGPGNVSGTITLRTSGAAVRMQLFGTNGNVQLGNGATGGSGNGIVSMVTTTAPTGTPPAAGAYLYVDPADSKLKAKTSGGTVTILTPVI